MPFRLNLTESDYLGAAQRLRVEVAALKAVAAVEAPQGGFLPDKQVTILFERHIFSKLTGHKYDMAYPDISNRKPGGYVGGKGEHSRLAKAVALDRNAALQSCSWGKYQIMGFNYAVCGCKTLQEFVNQMCKSEQAQLGLFCNYLMTRGLDKILRNRQFQTFAKLYNGPGYAEHKYDERLVEQYRKHGGVTA